MDVFVPFVLVTEGDAPVPTERRVGLGVGEANDEVPVTTRLVGMRDGVASSVLSKDSVEPCLDGGFEPPRLTGREVGLELPREGVKPVL